MSTGYLYDFLLKTISDEYGSTLTSINNKIIQTQIQSVKFINDGLKCKNCLSIFIDDQSNPEIYKLIDVIEGRNFYKTCNSEQDCNKSLCNKDKNDPCIVDTTDNTKKCLNFNRDAICYSSCVTELCNLNLENSMNFNIENFQNPSKEDIANITKNINNKIQKEYNDTTYDSTNDINNVIQILTKIDFSQQISTSQVATQVQIITINGPAQIYNVNMSIVSDIIMKAIINNSESVSLITNISNQLIEQIKNDVNHDFLSNFQYAWQKLKKFVIITCIIFLCIIVGIVILLILNAYKRR